MLHDPLPPAQPQPPATQPAMLPPSQPQSPWGQPPGAGQQWNSTPLALPPVSPGSGGRTVAFVALIVAGLALLGVAGIAALLFFAPGGAGGGYPLQGEVVGVLPGQVLSGDRLERFVSDTIADDGGTVERLDCPDTPKVAQGVVTVCHGVVDGFDSTDIVFFEDETGTFTVTEH